MLLLITVIFDKKKITKVNFYSSLPRLFSQIPKTAYTLKMNANCGTYARDHKIYIKHWLMLIIIFIAILGVVGLVIVFLHVAYGVQIIPQGAVLCGYVLVFVSILTPTVSGCVCLCCVTPFSSCCYSDAELSQYSSEERNLNFDQWNSLEMNNLDMKSKIQDNDLHNQGDVQEV